MPSGPKLHAITQTKMTFNAFVKEISARTGSAYGAGPAGFRRLMKRLGNPQNSYQIIHVAGTNGKGSVCYLSAEILKAAGYKTGLFISPHLHCPTERIQINGRAISRADFMCLCKQVFAAEEEKLNFFEILTAVAFLYFAEKKTDWVVLETGLGGEKDPTNICKPTACVISSIGLDHCQILGNTLGKIAHEKAGIIKRAIPVFCPPFSSEIMQEIRSVAEQKQASLHIVKQGHPFKTLKINWRKSEWILKKGTDKWTLHLLGEKQVQNACVVYQLFRRLNIPERAIQQGFARVQVPGRFEIIHRERKTIILDGSHNPQAVKNLIQFIRKSPWKNKIAVVCGFMADKDYPKMLRLLNKNTTMLCITKPGGERSATLGQMGASLPTGAQVNSFELPEEALTAALKKYPAVLVTGSFYLVSRVRARMRMKKMIDTGL